MLIEPFVTLVAANGVAVRWKGVEDYYPFKAQNGVVMYSEKFMRERPEPARRWMVAYLRGVRAYTAALSGGGDRAAIDAILAKYTAVKNPALYAKMQPIDFDANGRLELRSLELDQDWFLNLGLQQQRADLAQVIDYRYVDDAVRRLAERR